MSLKGVIFMRKIMIILLKILVVMALLFVGFLFYIFNEFGASPSKEDLLSYSRFSYFKDGEFQSPEKIVHDFENVRNGSVGFGRFLVRSPFAPQADLPKVMLAKKDFKQKSRELSVYWLGHSSAIIEIAGKRIIFDPVFDNAAPIPFAVPRYDKAPITRDDLPEVDYIVITHSHYDHLEKATVKSIKSGIFIVPLGVGSALKSWGVDENRIIELAWEEEFYQEDFKVIAEKGVHYSNRSPFNRNKTLWNSYVIVADGKNVFWSGDTGYSEHFVEIGKKYGSFDFAAIEIDGWNPGWANTHLFPKEVVMAAKDLNVKNILPIHWGVFDLALHPWHESIDMLLDEAQGTGLNIMTPKMGEKINLESKTHYWWRD